MKSFKLLAFKHVTARVSRFSSNPTNYIKHLLSTDGLRALHPFTIASLNSAVLHVSLLMNAHTFFGHRFESEPLLVLKFDVAWTRRRLVECRISCCTSELVFYSAGGRLNDSSLLLLLLLLHYGSVQSSVKSELGSCGAVCIRHFHKHNFFSSTSTTVASLHVRHVVAVAPLSLSLPLRNAPCKYSKTFISLQMQSGQA